MSLGIFDRLFTLLEGECKRLDVAMASAKSGGGVGGESFQRYTAALKHLATLRLHSQSPNRTRPSSSCDKNQRLQREILRAW